MPAERRSGPLLRVTLWFLGLLVALMVGMLSAYLVVSGLYLGSRVLTRLRGRGRDDVARVG